METLKTTILSLENNAEKLEALYRETEANEQTDAFGAAISALFHEHPDNLLYGAWYHRLRAAVPVSLPEKVGINWRLALPLSLLSGLLFWWVSGDWFMVAEYTPGFLIFWAPLAAWFVLAFLVGTSNANRGRALAVTAVLVGISLFIYWRIPGESTSAFDHYFPLMALHLPLLAWVGVGYTLIGLRSSPNDRFAFIQKSAEVFITGGLYLMAVFAFSGLTVGMFEALDISLSDVWMRLLFAGGAGALPVLAVASVYNPLAHVTNQAFGQGVGKIIPIITRVLLFLGIILLAAYLVAIPFNFWAPFENRDVLIVYNAMLFGVMAVLFGVVPLDRSELSPRLENILRVTIMIAAGMAIVVSLYAFAAIMTRTFEGRLTMNRFTIIGWNAINIGLLVYLLVGMVRAGRAKWLEIIQRVFGTGAFLYFLWTVVILVVVPLVFTG